MRNRSSVNDRVHNLKVARADCTIRQCLQVAHRPTCVSSIFDSFVVREPGTLTYISGGRCSELSHGKDGRAGIGVARMKLMHRTTLGMSIALGLLALVSAAAQTSQEQQKPQEPQTPIFRSNARAEVPIYATVMDSSSRLVPDLDRTDFTVLDDGKPVAIIAWREVGDVAQTAFAAHENFFTRSTIRFCKQHIRRIQALCGNLPIDSYSWSSRPEVAKWFRVLGFRERERGIGFTIFELDPE